MQVHFSVVELQVLEALDGIQWLGTGEQVASKYALSQSGVSRNCSKALRVFELEMQKQNGEWEILGDQTFLRLERQVHQLARRKGRRPLRLEATYWSAPTLCTNLPPHWMLGRSDIVGIKRNFQLLDDCVVDAWLAGLPDLPGANHPDLTAMVITSMPVFFTCAPDHPLLQRRDLSFNDIAEFPTLALPSGSYPLVEAGLREIGLWNDGVRMTRYRRERWEGRTETELVIGYGTPLSLQISGGELCQLPLELPFRSGDALVIRRELANDPAVAALLEALSEKARELSAAIPEIEVLR